MLLALTDEDRRSLLHRAGVISLFSWARAEPSDMPGETDLLGWWADSFPSVADDKTGSRLYLLRRRKLVPETIQDAIDWANEALAWFVVDGHASAVQVEVERLGDSGLAMRALILLLDDDPLLLEIDDIWRVINVV